MPSGQLDSWLVGRYLDLWQAINSNIHKAELDFFSLGGLKNILCCCCCCSSRERADCSSCKKLDPSVFSVRRCRSISLLWTVLSLLSSSVEVAASEPVT